MGTTLHVLASGPGWSVCDIVCGAGPHDRPFEEQHEDICIAAVTQGTFQYRSREGSAVLAPGALLLGNPGTCFECGHEHGTGDRCLAFSFTPALLESIVSGVPGARRAAFGVPHLPPVPALMPLLAAAVAATLADGAQPAAAPSRRDERRISDALCRIEGEAHEPLALADLAYEAGMSRYHFLRTFRQVAGMTPHQLVLRTRLHRAAVRLRTSDYSISTIAFDAGFGDLSTFNRRFRRLMGCSPGAWRAGSGRP